jgi:hypothetical protein
MYEASATLPGRAVNAMANDKRATIAGLVGDLHQALTNYDQLPANRKARSRRRARAGDSEREPYRP